MDLKLVQFNSLHYCGLALTCTEPQLQTWAAVKSDTLKLWQQPCINSNAGGTTGLVKRSYVSLLCEGWIDFVPLTAGQKPSWVLIFLVVSPHNQSRNMFSSAWGWISLLVSLAEKVSRTLPVLIFVSSWMDLAVVRFPHKINTGHSNDKPLINRSFKST